MHTIMGFVPLTAEAEGLSAAIPASALPFVLAKVWNPSPSRQHRTAPYELPQRISVGIRGNELCGARYSPPPYAVILEDQGGGRKALVAVAADPGCHLWNIVVFDCTSAGTTVAVDLEGHNRPAAVAPHVRLAVILGADGETRHQLLARGMQALYPECAAAGTVPEWWLKPIYCGYGDQVTTAVWLEGLGPERRALTYCLQGLYERWTDRLDAARVPYGTVTIDAGWSPSGVWDPNPITWPDLKGFVSRMHDAGKRVLLWIPTWLWDGLPDGWCVFAGAHKLVADPTIPEYREFVTGKVRNLLSPEGVDADGFKIDQLAYCPCERMPSGGARFGASVFPEPTPRPQLSVKGEGWGCELLHLLQKTIYDAAKAAKADALVTSSTVHPYFHDTFDMVRIHDMGDVPDDIFAAMKARVDLARAVLPGKPVDTDDWIHTDYQLWLEYTAGSRALGVPCIFYAERFLANLHEEPATTLIPLEDLGKIAAAWRRDG